MDPNVQVAIATVIGTLITTLGVVVVALINNRRVRDAVEPPKNYSELLEMVGSLIQENARKEATINRLREENVRLNALIPKEVTDA